MPLPFQDDCHKVLEYDDGELRLWLPRSTVVLSRVRGYLRHEYALAIIECLDAMRVTANVSQFHDWLSISGFDIRAQRDLTNWHISQRSRVHRLEIAAQSGLVRMGVTVANIGLRGLIRLHHDQSSLEQAAETALSSSS